MWAGIQAYKIAQVEKCFFLETQKWVKCKKNKKNKDIKLPYH